MWLEERRKDGSLSFTIDRLQAAQLTLKEAKSLIEQAQWLGALATFKIISSNNCLSIDSWRIIRSSERRK